LSSWSPIISHHHQQHNSGQGLSYYHP
jgi:hypothetical protein